MEKSHLRVTNWAIAGFLMLIVAFNLTCSYCGFTVGIQAFSVGLVPILLLLYFHKKKLMSPVFVVIFMLFFFGMITRIVENFSLSTKLSQSFFIGTYLLLIFVLMGKLSALKLEGFVSWYLIVVFMIAMFLVFQLFTAAMGDFPDHSMFTLAIIKGVALLVMAFLAFAIYLSKETTNSIVFLMVVCCFMFSEVLNFITATYVQFWVFEAFHKIFEGIGLLLTLIYAFDHQYVVLKKWRKNRYKQVSKSNHLSSVPF